jgi:membrane protein
MPRRAHSEEPAAPRDLSPAGVLAAVPDRLRPRAALLLGHRVGAVLLRTVREVVRVQLFDRAMTVAAQVFTSIFPLLIMLSALLGYRLSHRLAEAAHLPASSQRLIEQALGDRGASSFGVIGSLVVLLSATGLARALARAYGSIWDVTGLPSGPRAAWRWLLTVVLVTFATVGGRLVGWLTGDLPAPYLFGGCLLVIAGALVGALPQRLLLGRRVVWWKVLPGGLIFGLMLLALRPAGSIYLPRALRASDERYGTIGLAFTYIGWLYVLSFALLLATILGRVLVEELRWVRLWDRLSRADRGRPTAEPFRAGPARDRE